MVIPPRGSIGPHRHPVPAETVHLDEPNEVLWSRGNLDEALPGVVTPLSWGFWSRAFDWPAIRIYRDRLGVVSASEADEMGAAIGTCTAALYHGRAVANVDMLRMVMDRMPGGDPDAFELQLLGSVRPDAISSPTRERYPAIARRLPVSVALVKRRVVANRARTHEWWRTVTRSGPVDDLDAARQLFVESLHRFTDVTVDHSTALFLGQAAYQRLADLVAAAGHPGLELALASSGRGTEETEMVDDIWAAASGTLGLDELLGRHGYHGPSEGELSGRSWRDDPTPLRALLATYTERDGRAGALGAAVERRADAEATLFASLPRAGRASARLTLAATDFLLPLRETGKASFLQAIDVARLSARSIGATLVRSGHLADIDDVFLCTWEELACDPFGVDRDVVDERRRMLDRYRALDVPETFVGVPGPIETSDRTARTGPISLAGTGASPGVVEGTARILAAPGEVGRLRAGDVLVTTVTDPGWAPVFELASAVVVDTGTALSHAAIVARELGIPGVVGVRQASRSIPDGARVRVDGAAGTVEVLERLVHHFDDAPPADRAMARTLLGGKGAHLAEMRSTLGLPVPPGFTLTTDAWRHHRTNGWTDELDVALGDAIARVEQATGRRFGGDERPLLVSVRSGAAVSMPGMMDTILDVGIDDAVRAALAAETGDPDFATDCRARFVEMFDHTVGQPPPPEPRAQLRAAIEAVFRSWDGERARSYRKVEGIADDLGTAVNVQAMVFGNVSDDSATGVVFSRDPATGVPVLYGDVLFRAQGEDVVAGTHPIEPITALDERLPAVGAELRTTVDRLERHLRDLVDVEFTVERSKLWILQVRAGKRSPAAALRIAIDMADDPDFPLSRAEAVERTASLLEEPPQGRTVDTSAAPLASGLGASPGVAVGRCVLSSTRAVELASDGPVVLVRAATSPDDVAGMAVAAGILTSSGGLASHAAVVARGWGIPSVVGLAALRIDEDGRSFEIGDRRFAEGDLVSIDGGTGAVYAGDATGATTDLEDVRTLRSWGERHEPDAEDDRRADGHAYPTTVTPDGSGDLDAVLVALSVVGMASPERIAPIVGLLPGVVRALLDDAAREGVAEVTGHGAVLTDDGVRRAAALLRAQADRLGCERALAALEAFRPLDVAVKELVTAWQLSGDPSVHDRLRAELESLQGRVDAFFAPLAAVPSLRHHGPRLAGAVAAVRAGDARFVASPRVDSYHNVWFELHEVLIRLAGRTRADEVEAEAAG